ncbi:MAG: hypothetical protein JOY66_16135 [Acetobacteraceae bacterium]|nr:hypothetical protein [Acetobacteraceae bacterium]
MSGSEAPGPPPALNSRAPPKPWFILLVGGGIVAGVFAAGPLMRSTQPKPPPPEVKTAENPAPRGDLTRAPDRPHDQAKPDAQKRDEPKRGPPAPPETSAIYVGGLQPVVQQEPPRQAAGNGANGGPGAPGQRGELDTRLEPTLLTGAEATRDTALRYQILPGTVIPCTMESDIKTGLAGFATARLKRDVYGADPMHPIKLLDAYGLSFGTIQSGSLNGLDRAFVLWQTVTNANGVQIAINSPAADELGATGLQVSVNRHWLQKIEGAALVSVVTGGGQALGALASSAFSRQGNNNTNLDLNFNQFQAPTSEIANVLAKGLIDIPDTGERPHGTACSIYVARLLDFRKVYGIRVLNHERGVIYPQPLDAPYPIGGR